MRWRCLPCPSCRPCPSCLPWLPSCLCLCCLSRLSRRLFLSLSRPCCGHLSSPTNQALLHSSLHLHCHSNLLRPIHRSSLGSAHSCCLPILSPTNPTAECQCQ